MQLFRGSKFDRRIWVLFWSRLIDGAGFSIVSPFLARHEPGLGVSMALVGLVLWSPGLLEPPAVSSVE
jgi:hypothetical protein